MNFKNMSIRKSLIVGFGTTIVISVIIIVTALVMMTSQKNAYKDILDRYVASTDMIALGRPTMPSAFFRAWRPLRRRPAAPAASSRLSPGRLAGDVKHGKYGDIV